MNNNLETMKISKLIDLLKKYQKELGDVPVFHQTDPECNGYGTIDHMSICYMDTNIGKAIFISPFHEYIEDELF